MGVPHRLDTHRDSVAARIVRGREAIGLAAVLFAYFVGVGAVAAAVSDAR